VPLREFQADRDKEKLAPLVPDPLVPLSKKKAALYIRPNNVIEVRGTLRKKWSAENSTHGLADRSQELTVLATSSAEV
jgi:hypothetical protein